MTLTELQTIAAEVFDGETDRHYTSAQMVERRLRPACARRRLRDRRGPPTVPRILVAPVGRAARSRSGARHSASGSRCGSATAAACSRRYPFTKTRTPEAAPI
jgi:hypothetical protein